MPSAPKQQRKPVPSPQRNPSTPSHGAPELVDPSFILKALGVLLAIALILSYATICLTYQHTAWQLVLHPTRTLASTPAAQNLPFTEVHFGVDSSSEPQLDGWWIPADITATRTVLLLHGADGNMADALPTAALLHTLNLNVLLFDYRGYGQSAGLHPTESMMQADAASAVDYLLDSRHLTPASLVVEGIGLGAPIALDLCASSKLSCRALILDGPDGDTLDRVRGDQRSRSVPVSLLFHDTFALAGPLAAYSGPRLIILHSNNQPPAIFRNGKSQSMTLSILPGDTEALRTGIQRFLEDHP